MAAGRGVCLYMDVNGAGSGCSFFVHGKGEGGREEEVRILQQ